MAAIYSMIQISPYSRKRERERARESRLYQPGHHQRNISRNFSLVCIYGVYRAPSRCSSADSGGHQAEKIKTRNFRKVEADAMFLFFSW